MLDFKGKILDIVKSDPGRLVLPEGKDLRVLKAAEMIIREKFTTELIVLGDPDELRASAKQEGIDLKGVTLSNPELSPQLDEYAHILFESRKHKGMSENEALATVKDDVYHGAMLVKQGVVDAMVSGSASPTSKTVRASLIIVKPREGIRTISGSFVMITPRTEFGKEGAFIYADCGVVPEPTSAQLVDIAIGSADTARKLLDMEPVVAFLSFSTKGSANSPSVLKVRDAVEMLRDKNPDFVFDGEMQFDAAIIPSIAKKKAPDSAAAGKANVFIFPDLNAGNIGYKMTQRLAQAEAYGPLLQGLSKPVNDLSRGCSAEDIMVVSAITVAQSK